MGGFPLFEGREGRVGLEGGSLTLSAWTLPSCEVVVVVGGEGLSS